MDQGLLIPCVLALLLPAGTAPAQELLWELMSLDDAYVGVADSFGDLDQDGYEDLLTYCYPSLANGGGFAVRVLSGRDGSVLDNHLPFGVARPLVGVGDFDGDGHPDHAMTWDDQVFRHYVQVWSPHLDRQLLQLSEPIGIGFGGLLAGRVDLNGDGQQDLLVASDSFLNPDVRGYDHQGNQLYRVPIAPFNAVVLDLLGLDDLDGDRCSDFLVGGIEYSLGYSRGYVALLSGRTGAILRVHVDPQQRDLIGKPLCAAGDLDRDGVQDYLSGNYWSSSGRGGLIVAWSGATGAVLQTWQGTGSATVIGGRDADLDGFPDVIAGQPNYVNPSFLHGRIRVRSSRDRQVLMHFEPMSPVYDSSYAGTMADLGVQPGSPYPVFAQVERPSFLGTHGHRRIQVWRCTPPGASVTGSGCSSNTPTPTLGIRRVTTPAGEESRIVLGSAPPGALAWCAVAPAAANTFSGLPLPIALGPYGYPGCSLHVPATTNAARAVGSTGFDRGYAEVDLPRALATTGGLHLAAQWLVLDLANAAFAATPRCELRLQP